MHQLVDETTDDLAATGWLPAWCWLLLSILLLLLSMASPSFAVDLSWANSWPLYTVYPGFTTLFVGLYFGGPKFWPKLVPRYAKMSNLNQQCWRQNTNSMLHATVVTLVIFVAILTDTTMRDSRPLHPHYNLAGYIAICISLAHFTWTIPWSYNLYFRKGERHATNLALCIHHGIVFVACIVYLISRTCSLYGAVAYSSMEFTNMFFIPHILQQQLRSTWHKFWNANYIVLVIAFVALRLVLCTYMAVLFSQDVKMRARPSAVSTSSASAVPPESAACKRRMHAPNARAAHVRRLLPRVATLTAPPPPPCARPSSIAVHARALLTPRPHLTPRLLTCFHVLTFPHLPAPSTCSPSRKRCCCPVCDLSLPRFLLLPRASGRP